MILVVAEQRGGKLNRATWETIAAAQQLSSGGMPIKVVVLGPAGGVPQELAGGEEFRFLKHKNSGTGSREPEP